MADVPDGLVRAYLYFLVITNLLLLVLWIGYWIKNRQLRPSLARAKYLLLDLLYLITGLLAWYVLSKHILENWLILAGISGLLILSAYAVHFLGILLQKRLGDHDRS